MKLLNLALIALITSITSCASNKPKVNNDSEFIKIHGHELFERQKLSSYLVMYDKLAWITSDTLMKYEKERMNGKVGTEWFAYKKGDNFIITYGKFVNGIYESFVRYTISDNNTIIKTNESDSLIEWKYAKAINLVSDSAFDIMNEQKYKYNWYVFSDSGTGNIKVLYLPEVGPNFEIVYGNEFSYTLNNSVDRIVTKEKSDRPLRFYMLNDKEDIIIYDRNEELPDIGSLYAIERWVNSKSNISVKTKKNLFTLMKTNKNEFAWVTVTK